MKSQYNFRYCNLKIKQKSLDTHLENDCKLNYMKKCQKNSHGENGCGAFIFPRDYEKHLLFECPDRAVRCTQCSKRIKAKKLDNKEYCCTKSEKKDISEKSESDVSTSTIIEQSITFDKESFRQKNPVQYKKFLILLPFLTETSKSFRRNLI